MSEERQEAEAVETGDAGEALTEDEARYFETEGVEEAADADAAPEPEAGAEAAEAAPEPEPSPEKPPAGHVPLSALHEERERRKELQARLEALEQKLARPAEPEADPDPEPDKGEDLAGWLEWRARQVEGRAEKLEQAQAEAQQAAQRNEAMAHVRQTVAQREQAFRTEHPDYDAAYDFARETERRRLAEVEGVTDAAQQDAIIARAEQQLVMTALQQGRNPAEIVYNFAKFHGYDPSPREGSRGFGSQAPRQDKPANPAAPAPKPAPPKSLGAARTAPAGDGLTPESIAAMPDAEFTKLVATKAGREKVNALMGGDFVPEY